MEFKNNYVEGNYSPSRTMKYMDCPKLVDLESRWEPRSRVWTPNQLLGTVIAKGLEVYYKRQQSMDMVSLLYTLDDCYETMLQGLTDEYVTQDTWTLEGLIRLVKGGFEAALSTGLPLGGSIILVEEDIGGRRPDLVYRSESGGLMVVDHKVTLSCKPEYVQSRLDSYKHNWQFADYAYHVGQRYGEPVEKVGVHLIVLTPKPKAYVDWIEFSPEQLYSWEQDAKLVWNEMDVARDMGLYRRNYNYCTRWGTEPGKRCKYYELCHDLVGDESKAELFYDRIYKDSETSNI